MNSKADGQEEDAMLSKVGWTVIRRPVKSGLGRGGGGGGGGGERQ